jgi:hypothetical protein
MIETSEVDISAADYDPNNEDDKNERQKKSHHPHSTLKIARVMDENDMFQSSTDSVGEVTKTIDTSHPKTTTTIVHSSSFAPPTSLKSKKNTQKEFDMFAVDADEIDIFAAEDDDDLKASADKMDVTSQHVN